MGCSPPSWWYESQARHDIARRRWEHQQEVDKLVQLLKTSTDEERQRIRTALNGGETSETSR